MSVAHITAQIHETERKIDSLQQKLNRLLSRIDELDHLRGQYTRLQQRFEERQHERETNLEALRRAGIQNRIATRYYEGMRGLLRSSSFYHADESLRRAKETVTRKINQLEMDADECRSNISYYSHRRNELLRQLWAAMEQEGQ